MSADQPTRQEPNMPSSPETFMVKVTPEPSRQAAADLERGGWYEFTYRHHSGNGRWYEWQTTCQLLDVQEGTIPNRRVLVVNMRPLAGTSEIPERDLLAVAQARPNPTVKLPQRTPGGLSGKSEW